MKKLNILLVFIINLLICYLSTCYAQSDSQWPMFRHDVMHSGRCTYICPSVVGLKWSYTANKFVLSSPTIDSSGTIYFGTADEKVYALYQDGRFKWTYDTSGPTSGYVYSTPTIREDGVIFFGSDNGFFYAVEPTGIGIWSYQTGSSISSSAVIDKSNGNVYIGSSNSKLFAFGESTSLFLELYWTKTLGGEIEATPALDTDGRLYAASHDGRFYSYTSGGGFRWSTIDTKAEIKSSPALSNDGVSYYAGNDNGYLYWGSSKYGSLYWSHFIGGYIKASPAIGSDGSIYIGSSNGKFYCFESAGPLLWMFPKGNTTVGTIYSSAAIDGDGNIYFGSEDGFLYALDSAGQLKWSYKTDGKIVRSSPAIDSDGVIYIGSYDNKLHAISQLITPTITKTPTPTATATMSETQTETFTPTNTITKTQTETTTASQTKTSTPTNTKTMTPTPTDTDTSSQTPTPTDTNPDFKPELSDPQLIPEAGNQNTSFEYLVHYKDADGGNPQIKRLYINNENNYMSMSLRSGDPWDGIYHIKDVSGFDLNIGENEFFFLFIDNETNSVRLPEEGFMEGPWVDPVETKTPTSTPTLTATPTDQTDRELPEVIITSPLDRERVSGIILIKVNASDPSGISSVEVKFDDGLEEQSWQRCTRLGDKWIHTWNTRDYNDLTQVTISARATDNSRNANTGQAEDIVVLVRKWDKEYWIGGNTGEDGDGTSNNPFKSITYALSRATSAEKKPAILRIIPGIYDSKLGEKFPIELKSHITIEGINPDSTTENANPVDIIIDASESQTAAFSFVDKKDVGIKGFTIIGGKGNNHPSYPKIRLGGGIFSINSSPVITNCTIEGNSAEFGGGIYSQSNTIEIIGCNIINNESRYGGGVLIWDSQSLLFDSIVEDNSNIESGFGGGIISIDSLLGIKKSRILRNRSYLGGGALCYDSTLLMINVEMNENRSSLYGGGLLCYRTSGDIAFSKLLGNSTGESNLESHSNSSDLNENIFNDNSKLFHDMNLNEITSLLKRENKIEKKGPANGESFGSKGGGIYFEESSPKVSFCSISENTANLGGGVYCYKSSPSIISSFISGNEVYNNSNAVVGEGGGLYFIDSNPKIIESRISKNHAQWVGGAIFCGSDTNLELLFCELNSNDASFGGGGIFGSENCELTISDCLFEANHSFSDVYSLEQESAPGGYGGGLVGAGCQGTITGSQFINNTANNGGGIVFYGSSFSVSLCDFSGNLAQGSLGIGGDGGGLYSYDSSFKMTDSTIKGNLSRGSLGIGGDGGGLYCEDSSSIIFENCLISNNSANGNTSTEQDNQDSRGGAIFNKNSELIIFNCTIAGNAADQGSGILSIDSGLSNLVNSIYWDNGDVPLTTNAEISFSDIEGGYPGEGNIDLYPEFTDVAGENRYFLSHISSGQEVDSPCIDAGTNSIVENLNLNWKTTRTDGVTDSGKIDMGYHNSAPLSFELRLEEEKESYGFGDRLKLNVNLKTFNKAAKNADIYFILIDPIQQVWFGLKWGLDIKSLISDLSIPSELDLKDLLLFQTSIPSMMPPINNPGTYIFGIAATETGSSNFISNLGMTNFFIN